jgi:hypothetical protein
LLLLGLLTLLLLLPHRGGRLLLLFFLPEQEIEQGPAPLLLGHEHILPVLCKGRSGLDKDEQPDQQSQHKADDLSPLGPYLT